MNDIGSTQNSKNNNKYSEHAKDGTSNVRHSLFGAL